MKTLRGTKTAENLLAAFAGESQARTRYTFYASTADKEGYKQIKNIFIETAENEKEHAAVFYKHLLEGFKDELPAMVEIRASYPVARASTVENLKAAADGEREEWAELYARFAETADEEGFPEVANSFRFISKVEQRHEARYRKLAGNLENGSVFAREKKVLWKCGNCGYILESESAPVKCPACQHPQAYFELFVEAY